MTLTPEAIIRLGVDMRKAQEKWWSNPSRKQSITAVGREHAFDAAASEYLAQIEREK